jgi:uncharacterized membrane protein
MGDYGASIALYCVCGIGGLSLALFVAGGACLGVGIRDSSTGLTIAGGCLLGIGVLVILFIIWSIATGWWKK